MASSEPSAMNGPPVAEPSPFQCDRISSLVGQVGVDVGQFALGGVQQPVRQGALALVGGGQAGVDLLAQVVGRPWIADSAVHRGMCPEQGAEQGRTGFAHRGLVAHLLRVRLDRDDTVVALGGGGKAVLDHLFQQLLPAFQLVGARHDVLLQAAHLAGQLVVGDRHVVDFLLARGQHLIFHQEVDRHHGQPSGTGQGGHRGRDLDARRHLDEAHLAVAAEEHLPLGEIRSNKAACFGDCLDQTFQT